MGDSRVLARIDAWAAAGLIDGATAERLRSAEASADAPGNDGSPAARRAGLSPSALFGPGVRVGEMFGYLGGAFLLAAWFALLARLSGGEPGGEIAWAGGLVLAGVAVALLGLRVRSRSARMGRFAGVALLISGPMLGGAAWAAFETVRNGGPTGLDGNDSTLVAIGGAGAWVVAATVYRRLHGALLTQAGLIAAIVALAAAAMRWLEAVLFPASTFAVEPLGPDSPVRAVLIGVGWGVAAVVLGILGLREAASVRPGAGARAALTRFAAGLTAVLGVTSAIMTTGYLATDEYGRLIPPIVGDAILIAVSAVLLERAFRRTASAFVYPAALGVIIGLSDLNGTYVSSAVGSELALLVEGLILLAAGVGFDRLRRRVGTADSAPEAPAGTPSGSGVAGAETTLSPEAPLSSG